MNNQELTAKIAQALYRRTWPAYVFEKQDAETKYAWLDQAEQLLQTLEMSGLTIREPGLLQERSDIVIILRDVCKEFGDNDWTDDDHLGDVIEKHLAKHLWAKEKKTDDTKRSV